MMMPARRATKSTPTMVYFLKYWPLGFPSIDTILTFAKFVIASSLHHAKTNNKWMSPTRVISSGMKMPIG